MERMRPGEPGDVLLSKNIDIRQILRVAGEYALLALAIIHLSKLAFSYESKREIIARDGYKCVECGATENLEAAHYDHTRNENYDNPDNGRMLCTACHLKDHKTRTNNGLSKKHNSWAIQTMEARLAERKETEAKQLALL